jgi:hypothetical protein
MICPVDYHLEHCSEARFWEMAISRKQSTLQRSRLLHSNFNRFDNKKTEFANNNFNIAGNISGNIS